MERETASDGADATPPRPRRVQRPLGRFGLYLVLVLTAGVFLGPLYWLVSSAFKSSADVYRFPVHWLPLPLHWSNFTDAWHAAPFGNFFINSLVVTVIGASIKVINAVLSAYAFTFLRFPGRDVLFYVVVGALMVPGNLTVIVNYLTVSDLGWVNTYAGLILPSAGSAFGTFLLRQQMRTFPVSILEAARIDGAGHLRILWQIVLPMSRPTLVTVSIIAVVDMWNEFLWPLVVTNTANMRTLPVGLLYLKSEEGFNNWGTIMAGTVIVVIPVLAVFLIAQRYIMAGLTAGAVKG